MDGGFQQADAFCARKRKGGWQRKLDKMTRAKYTLLELVGKLQRQCDLQDRIIRKLQAELQQKGNEHGK